MYWRKIFFIQVVFLQACFFTAYGQPVDFFFHKLSEEDGIPQSEEYFFYRDTKGYVWIGSDDGLHRFDGQNLESYRQQQDQPSSLPDNRITSQCYKGAGNDLWFTTHRGLVVYHREQEKFELFSVPLHQEPYQAFHHDEENRLWVRVGGQPSGSLWFFDLNTLSFSQSLPLTGKTCQILNGDDGQPAFIVQTELPNQPGLKIIDLASQDEQMVEFLKTSKDVARNRSSPTIGLYPDKDNTIWTGVYNGLGKYRLGDDEITATAYVEKSDQVSTAPSFVTDIVPIQDSFFLVSSDEGLFLFDRKNELFSYQFQSRNDQPGSLPRGGISTLMQDQHATFWLGSRQGEIAFTTKRKHLFRKVPRSTGLFITKVQLSSDNDIWISTLKNHSYRIEKKDGHIRHIKEFINTHHPDGKFTLPVVNTFLGDSNQSWWAKVGNQFLYWSPDKQKFIYYNRNTFGVPNSLEDRIECVLERKNENILINHGRKIYELRIKGEFLDTLPWYNLQHLQLAPITFLGEDSQQNIFVGDQTGRLVVLKEKGEQISLLADIPNLGTIHALQADSARSTLWLATSKGLGQLDPSTFKLSWLTEEEHQLPQETYYNAIPDEFGQLWLPGNNGLVRYHPETKTFHRFTTADGLLSNVFSRNASLRVPATGEIWLGGKNGVNVFHPKDIKLSDFKPNISFSRLLVNDLPFSPEGENKGNLNEKESLTFDYEQNTLSFQFVALDYSDPEANEYYYQMEGYDEERVYTGTNNFVRYANLPAGEYSFKVWATNSDKVLNEAPKVLALIITPPFYQTWWFYLACLLVISAIIYAIFQYRLEQALKVERLRVKISSDLHDDVGGMLSGLAMQTEILELTAGEDTKPKLARIAELSRGAMSRMRDTVWAIDARKDKLENLLDRMREHAEETLAPKGIQFAIQLIGLDLKQDLTTDVRQNLYLIYKEAITNSAKHSNGDSVNVLLRQSSLGFEMSIHDNGEVADKAYKTTGLGQSNMRMRAEAIDAQLQVDTKEGFLVRLTRKGL